MSTMHCTGCRECSVLLDVTISHTKRNIIPQPECRSSQDGSSQCMVVGNALNDVCLDYNEGHGDSCMVLQQMYAKAHVGYKLALL